MQLGIPAKRWKVKMYQQVRAFRTRLVTGMRAFDARGGYLQYTPEFEGPSKQGE